MAEKQSKPVSAGASYLLNFYKEILTLTDYHAQYLNFLLEIENKYREMDKASDAEKETIKLGIQNVRHYCTKCYIQYKSIALGLKMPENTEIETIYTKIKTSFVISRDDTEKFVIALNHILVNEIIKDLLDKSEELVNKAFE